MSLPGGGLRNTPLWQLKDVLAERAAEAAEEAEENGGVGPPPPVLVVANPDVVRVWVGCRYLVGWRLRGRS